MTISLAEVLAGCAGLVGVTWGCSRLHAPSPPPPPSRVPMTFAVKKAKLRAVAEKRRVLERDRAEYRPSRETGVHNQGNIECIARIDRELLRLADEEARIVEEFEASEEELIP